MARGFGIRAQESCYGSEDEAPGVGSHRALWHAVVKDRAKARVASERSSARRRPMVSQMVRGSGMVRGCEMESSDVRGGTWHGAGSGMADAEE